MSEVSEAPSNAPVDPAGPRLSADHFIGRLNRTGGVVHTADLEWPLFDIHEVTTMSEYVGRIGVTMAAAPRDNRVKDSALRLFGRDFEQAQPARLAQGLYFPKLRGSKKGVMKVNVFERDFQRGDYPGELPFDTGIAVPEDVYEDLLGSGDYYADRVDNRTQRKHIDDPVVEETVGLGAESAVYALTGKHETLEARDAYLLERYRILSAVRRSIEDGRPRRLGNLEAYRLEAQTDIMEMARVACKSLGYGTNQTASTLNAVASNLHRADIAPEWWRAYTTMAMRYNTEIRGKIGQSIHVCHQEIERHGESLSSNLFRVYEDKK